MTAPAETPTTEIRAAVTPPAALPFATWTSTKSPAFIVRLIVLVTTEVPPVGTVHVAVVELPLSRTVNTSVVPLVGLGPKQ